MVECLKCGKCCRYVTVALDTPEDRLDWEETWFIRRILTVPSAKEKHGDVAVEALKALEAWLRKGGNEAIITLTLPRHSGGLYKKAGYVELAKTRKGDKVWFIRRLR